ncbi:hypothetical protein ANTRET_LOCUS2146 [Anthophora retusa]
MEQPTVSSILSSSFSPCSPNEIAIQSGDCVEGGVEECVLIGLCCCIRFRIPRTKQEIEADYIRKKITKTFRHELSKISNTEMDNMDLRKALNKLQIKFDMETYEVQKRHQEITHKSVQDELR